MHVHWEKFQKQEKECPGFTSHPTSWYQWYSPSDWLLASLFLNILVIAPGEDQVNISHRTIRPSIYIDWHLILFKKQLIILYIFNSDNYFS